jgi:multiple sugar transport system permease protein
MKRALRSLWHIPMILLGITMLAPLGLMVTTSLGTAHMALGPGVSLWHVFWPRLWNWHNFVDVWHGDVGFDKNFPAEVHFLRYYANSVIVAVSVTLGSVFTSACAAYAFARLRWPGRDRIFIAYLATMMVPGPVTLIPQFGLMKHLCDWLQWAAPMVDWAGMRTLGHSAGSPEIGRLVGLDSYAALIIPGLFSAYGTFLLRQFLLTIPMELDEAAKIDGASHWQTFWRIILPLARPGLATLAIFTFMGTWTSVLWPVVVTNLEALYTLPLGMQEFQAQGGAQWHYMMAASLLMLLPVIIVFLLGQRSFIRGLTLGAVKG